MSCERRVLNALTRRSVAWSKQQRKEPLVSSFEGKRTVAPKHSRPFMPGVYASTTQYWAVMGTALWSLSMINERHHSSRLHHSPDARGKAGLHAKSELLAAEVLTDGMIHFLQSFPTGATLPSDSVAALFVLISRCVASQVESVAEKDKHMELRRRVVLLTAAVVTRVQVSSLMLWSTAQSLAAIETLSEVLKFLGSSYNTSSDNVSRNEDELSSIFSPSTSPISLKSLWALAEEIAVSIHQFRLVQLGEKEAARFLTCIASLHQCSREEANRATQRAAFMCENDQAPLVDELPHPPSRVTWEAACERCHKLLPRMSPKTITKVTHALLSMPMEGPQQKGTALQQQRLMQAIVARDSPQASATSGKPWEKWSERENVDALAGTLMESLSTAPLPVLLPHLLSGTSRVISLCRHMDSEKHVKSSAPPVALAFSSVGLPSRPSSSKTRASKRNRSLAISCEKQLVAALHELAVVLQCIHSKKPLTTGCTSFSWLLCFVASREIFSRYRFSPADGGQVSEPRSRCSEAATRGSIVYHMKEEASKLYRLYELMLPDIISGTLGHVEQQPLLEGMAKEKNLFTPHVLLTLALSMNEWLANRSVDGAASLEDVGTSLCQRLGQVLLEQFGISTTDSGTVKVERVAAVARGEEGGVALWAIAVSVDVLLHWCHQLKQDHTMTNVLNRLEAVKSACVAEVERWPYTEASSAAVQTLPTRSTFAQTIVQLIRTMTEYVPYLDCMKEGVTLTQLVSMKAVVCVQRSDALGLSIYFDPLDVLSCIDHLTSVGLNSESSGWPAASYTYRSPYTYASLQGLFQHLVELLISSPSLSQRVSLNDVSRLLLRRGGGAHAIYERAGISSVAYTSGPVEEGTALLECRTLEEVERVLSSIVRWTPMAFVGAEAEADGGQKPLFCKTTLPDAFLDLYVRLLLTHYCSTLKKGAASPPVLSDEHTCSLLSFFEDRSTADDSEKMLEKAFGIISTRRLGNKGSLLPSSRYPPGAVNSVRRPLLPLFGAVALFGYAKVLFEKKQISYVSIALSIVEVLQSPPFLKQAQALSDLFPLVDLLSEPLCVDLRVVSSLGKAFQQRAMELTIGSTVANPNEKVLSCFSRGPSSKEKAMFVAYLIRADVTPEEQLLQAFRNTKGA